MQVEKRKRNVLLETPLDRKKSTYADN